MEESPALSAGGLKLSPYTRASYSHQLNRSRSVKARREEQGFKKERTTNLPECESVPIAPKLLPSTIFYTPLEDVGQFGKEKTFCVISADKSSNCYLYRFSAENSLYLFSPWSSIRRLAIRISCHRLFELFVLATILINCIFLSLNPPFKVAEYVFLAIYTTEIMIKIVAKGFILKKYCYLRDPWNWLDFVVILSGYVTISLYAAGVPIGNLAGLRTFRLLKTLKTVPGLKIIVNAMLRSLGMLAEVMMLTVFCLMVFALLALQLYVGLLRQKCVSNPEEETSLDWNYDMHVNNRSNWLFDDNDQPAICGNRTATRKCPVDYTCQPGVGENPNFGYTNFDSYGWALMTTFQLITLDYWEDVYNKVNATSGPASVFFFMLIVFFGSFYLINLTLAVVAIAYEEEALKEQENMLKAPANQTRQQSRRGRDNTKAAPISRFMDTGLTSGKSLPQPSSAGDATAIKAGVEQPGQERSARNQGGGPECTVQVLEEGSLRHSNQRNSSLGSCCRLACRMSSYLEAIVSDPLFDLMIIVCILLNTALLSVLRYGIYHETQLFIERANLAFVIIFTLETVIKMAAFGRSYFTNKWNIFDMVVVSSSLLQIYFTNLGVYSVLRTFHLVRVVKVGKFWPTMQLLLDIIGSTFGAVGNMTLVLALIVYIFAIMGVQLLGDVYTEENFAPDPVPRWNFTDFWHSLLLMFRIICGEWVQPLWDCMRAAGERQQVCIVLFMAAFVVGNFLVLNLFLALLLNSFAVHGLQEDKDKRQAPSKILKSFRRIKRAICGGEEDEPDQAGSVPPPVTPQESVGSHRRRWSEPGIVLPLMPSAKPSDVPIGVSNSLSRTKDTPSTLRDLSSSARMLSSSNNQLTLNVPPPSEAIAQEPQYDPAEGSPAKKEKERENKEPPDCCPACLFGNVVWEDRPFWRSWTKCRKLVLSVVDHKAFEWAVLLLIFSSSIVLCFEDVFLSEKPNLETILGYFNLIFTTCFVVEVILKWIAYGFVAYFRSLWNTLDFVIVVVSVASVIAESTGGGFHALRAIRTLRALRPLRAISRWDGMRIVVNALMSAIPSIFNVILVCLVFWLIFSIIGVQFFGGRFYRCVDFDGITLTVDKMRDDCQAMNYTWINRDINFDNVGNAYLALFQVATFEGWIEVMEHATDITGIDLPPQKEANLPAYLFFVVFIVLSSFFFLNLFIGVIIDNFNMLKKKYEGGIVEMFLTDSQRTHYTAMLKLGRRKPKRITNRPENRYLRICYDVAMSRRFEMVVFLLIVLNMVAMTVEHYQQPDEITTVLETLNIVFTTIFSIEAAIKIIGLRQYYFTYPWNVFDLIVIVTSVIGIIFEEALQKLVISPTLLRVLRLIRIGRILRLIRAAKGIRKLLFALIISMPALFNIGALLLLVTFVYAIIGMSLFGHVLVPESGQADGGLSDLVNFQTFANSMVLLFRVTTSAGWNKVLEPLMNENDCDPDYRGLPSGNCGQPIAAVIYLVSYIVINYMVIINMYIAIILENLSRANKEDTGIAEDDIEMFYVCWAQYDPSATQFINADQLSDFVASLDPPLCVEKPNEPALVAMDLPIATGDKIHCLDILNGLVNLVLGDVEDTEEYRVVQKQIDERFRKSFPTRNLVEIISTTLKRKQQHNAAKIIQRTYKKHLDKVRNQRVNSGVVSVAVPSL